MEAAEALCESVAIVDHGRLVAGGRLRELKKQSGRRTLRLAIDGDPTPGMAGRAARGRRRSARRGRLVAGAAAGRRPGALLAAIVGHGAARPPLRGRRTEPRIAVHRARRPPGRRRGRPPRAGRRPPTAASRDRGGRADGPARPAPAQRRDRGPARVPRPRPQPAVRRLDDHPERAGPPRRAGARSRSAISTASP